MNDTNEYTAEQKSDSNQNLGVPHTSYAALDEKELTNESTAFDISENNQSTHDELVAELTDKRSMLDFTDSNVGLNDTDNDMAKVQQTVIENKPIDSTGADNIAFDAAPQQAEDTNINKTFEFLPNESEQIDSNSNNDNSIATNPNSLDVGQPIDKVQDFNSAASNGESDDEMEKLRFSESESTDSKDSGLTNNSMKSDEGISIDSMPKTDSFIDTEASSNESNCDELTDAGLQSTTDESPSSSTVLETIGVVNETTCESDEQTQIVDGYVSMNQSKQMSSTQEQSSADDASMSKIGESTTEMDATSSADDIVTCSQSFVGQLDNNFSLIRSATPKRTPHKLKTCVDDSLELNRPQSDCMAKTVEKFVTQDSMVETNSNVTLNEVKLSIQNEEVLSTQCNEEDSILANTSSKVESADEFKSATTNEINTMANEENILEQTDSYLEQDAEKTENTEQNEQTAESISNVNETSITQTENIDSTQSDVEDVEGSNIETELDALFTNDVHKTKGPDDLVTLNQSTSTHENGMTTVDDQYFKLLTYLYFVFFRFFNR